MPILLNLSAFLIIIELQEALLLLPSLAGTLQAAQASDEDRTRLLEGGSRGSRGLGRVGRCEEADGHAPPGCGGRGKGGEVGPERGDRESRGGRNVGWWVVPGRGGQLSQYACLPLPPWVERTERYVPDAHDPHAVPPLLETSATLHTRARARAKDARRETQEGPAIARGTLREEHEWATADGGVAADVLEGAGAGERETERGGCVACEREDAPEGDDVKASKRRGRGGGVGRDGEDEDGVEAVESG